MTADSLLHLDVLLEERRRVRNLLNSQTLQLELHSVGLEILKSLLCEYSGLIAKDSNDVLAPATDSVGAGAPGAFGVPDVAPTPSGNAPPPSKDPRVSELHVKEMLEEQRRIFLEYEQLLLENSRLEREIQERSRLLTSPEQEALALAGLEAADRALDEEAARVERATRGESAALAAVDAEIARFASQAHRASASFALQSGNLEAEVAGWEAEARQLIPAAERAAQALRRMQGGLRAEHARRAGWREEKENGHGRSRALSEGSGGVWLEPSTPVQQLGALATSLDPGCAVATPQRCLATLDAASAQLPALMAVEVQLAGSVGALRAETEECRAEAARLRAQSAEEAGPRGTRVVLEDVEQLSKAAEASLEDVNIALEEWWNVPALQTATWVAGLKGKVETA